MYIPVNNFLSYHTVSIHADVTEILLGTLHYCKLSDFPLLLCYDYVKQTNYINIIITSYYDDSSKRLGTCTQADSIHC